MDKKSVFHWKHPLIIPQSEFNELSKFVRLLLDTAKVPVVGGLGEDQTDPIVDESVICFNGCSPHDCETFFFPRVSDDLLGVTRHDLGNFYRVCDTGKNPYDAVVLATLKAAEYLEIIPEWHCDGYEEEHIEGQQLYGVVKNYYLVKKEEKRRDDHGLPN